jgi:hypothetical protein
LSRISGKGPGVPATTAPTDPLEDGGAVVSGAGNNKRFSIKYAPKINRKTMRLPMG